MARYYNKEFKTKQDLDKFIGNLDDSAVNITLRYALPSKDDFLNKLASICTDDEYHNLKKRLDL